MVTQEIEDTKASPASPPIVDPDRALVLRAQEGELEAFEELVSRYEQRVYTLALRILRQREDAEEVVQEAFVSVLEHLETFRGEAPFKSWLLRIATNQALHVLRKRKGLSTVPFQEERGESEQHPLPHPQLIARWKESPERLAEQLEVHHSLARALEDIDEKYRLVFVLRDVSEFSTKETAMALNISEPNVKIRLLRARLMLRERLTSMFGDGASRMIPDHKHEGE